MANISQSLCCRCFCALAALSQDIVYIRKALLPLFSALTNRSQFGLDDIV